MSFRKTALVLLAGFVLCGCSTTITNLTPSRQMRNPKNLYPFEVAIQTSQQTIQQDTITPYVIIGMEKYPMQPTPLVKNRWEAQIPLPANTNYVYYQFKFDYKYDGIPHPSESSRRSQTYQLEIVDK
jgi:ubiquitin-protein ligase